jgi:hypothetical protein
MSDQASNPQVFDRRKVLAMTAGFAVLGPVRAGAQTAFNPYSSPLHTGPSSKPGPAIGPVVAAPASPYIIPVAPGWSATSLLTVGNEVNGYRLSGLPDGLGAFDNGDRTFTLLVNHEIAGGFGAMRGHGAAGGFVSRWVIHKDTLQVVSGGDFVTSPQKLFLSVDGAMKPADQAPAKLRELSRFCSADLAPVSAVFNPASGKGYNGRIFLNAEESNAGRSFGWVAEDGTCHELPAFNFGNQGDRENPPPGFENLLAHPGTGDSTVVMCNSDGGTYQVYVYIGAKQQDGSPVAKAGLTNGRIYSLLVEGVPREDRDKNVGIAKSLVGAGAGKRVGLAQPNRGTSFLRPEDGAWDPRNPNVFYFVTTDRNNFAADRNVREGQNVNQVGRARLWAITFDDVTRIATDGSPTAKIELLLDGSEGGDMFDNMTIDRDGIIYICEDIGTARHNSKIWSYDTNTGAFAVALKLDPAKFGDLVEGNYTPPVAPFLDDKETSGILDVTDIFASAAWYRAGSKVFVVTTQAHFKYDPRDPLGAQLIEGGQLLLLTKTG